jgi:hypothetical protein
MFPLLAMAAALAMGPPMASEPHDSRPSRRFMLGLEAVGLQTPPLRPEVARIDRRFLGNATTLAGLGLFGRFRPISLVGLELGVRSGSARYEGEGPARLLHDVFIVDFGTALYLLRGKIGQLAIDAGGGGIAQRVGYEFESSRGVQLFGSGFVRGGATAELLTKRVAIVFNIRAYAVVTDLRGAKNSGAVFETVPEQAGRAPVDPLQLWVLGTVGVAYRF